MSVDVHTHMYFPRYVEMLRERKQLPRIVQDGDGADRLLILPDEDRVRPLAGAAPHVHQSRPHLPGSQC